MAAGILAGLENSTNPKNNSEIYDPAVYLLYPTYRPQLEPKVDVIFVHGILGIFWTYLRNNYLKKKIIFDFKISGEPFVTWRQRDQIEDLEKNNTKDVNILDSNTTGNFVYNIFFQYNLAFI